ncbi:MAG: hypothetical protein HDQ88_09715 [Clostridia bacterium]|nr:hypothetical protein [Clostridia bacterium]
MKMEQQPDYRVYPSLLIAFQSLLDYELVAEEDWNKVTEAAHERGEYLDRDIGDYKLTPDEMYVKLECDLLDSINRVDGRYGEAAAKGTAFNEIVDCLIENRKSKNKDCIIYSTANASGNKIIRSEIDGFTFDFDVALCKETAYYFSGSLTQYYANATMETSFGTVLLYGFIDEWVGNLMYDIKTTGKYSWGKFEQGWQRHVYPWCVIEAGDTTEVESFTYYVVEWAYQKKGEPLKAKAIYQETYTYNHEESGRKIRDMLESFIPWLIERKKMGLIQDKRIFGGVNPEGWSGQPTDPNKLAKLLFKQSA